MSFDPPPHFITLAIELKELGLAPSKRSGSIVLRGFADLGHEAYLILPTGKLLSLFLGTVIPMPHDFEKHFIWLPDIEDAREVLRTRGAELLSLEGQPSNMWCAQYRAPHGELTSEVAGTINEVALLVVKRALMGA